MKMRNIRFEKMPKSKLRAGDVFISFDETRLYSVIEHMTRCGSECDACTCPTIKIKSVCIVDWEGKDRIGTISNDYLETFNACFWRWTWRPRR